VESRKPPQIFHLSFGIYHLSFARTAVLNLVQRQAIPRNDDKSANINGNMKNGK